MNWETVLVGITPVVTALGGGIIGWLSKDRDRERLARDVALLKDLPESARRAHEANIAAATCLIAEREMDHKYFNWRNGRRLALIFLVPACANLLLTLYGPTQPDEGPIRVAVGFFLAFLAAAFFTWGGMIWHASKHHDKSVEAYKKAHESYKSKSTH